MAKSTYWAVISMTGDEYLNGTTTYRFTTSVSSATELSPVVNITFSIASFDYLFASQFVDYDWVTLVGQLGGAAALASASHMVIMAIFAKLRKYYYRYVLGQDIDDEGEEKTELPEELEVVAEEETHANAKGVGVGGVVTATGATGGDSGGSHQGSAVYGSQGSFATINGGSAVFGNNSSHNYHPDALHKKRVKKMSVKRYSVVVVPQQLRQRATAIIPAGPPPRGRGASGVPAMIPPELPDRTPFLGYQYGPADDDSSSDEEDRKPDPRSLRDRNNRK